MSLYLINAPNMLVLFVVLHLACTEIMLMTKKRGRAMLESQQTCIILKLSNNVFCSVLFYIFMINIISFETGYLRSQRLPVPTLRLLSELICRYIMFFWQFVCRFVCKISFLLLYFFQMNQLAALSESVKSGNFTFNQDDLSIALRHAANDRITFLKNKENFVLEKDKEQLKLEQAAVAKLNELIENLSAPPKPESDMPALVEDLLKHWFNDLVLYLVTTILGSVYLYLKSRIEELNIAGEF